MNPKDLFEMSHYKLTPIELPDVKNLAIFDHQTFTNSSAQSSKQHSLLKITAEPIYYSHDGRTYLVGKKETQQGKSFVGYVVQYLTLIKYKGIHEMDNIAIETNLESLKKNKVYKVLSQNSLDNVKEGSEILVYNESRIEEEEEFSFSYLLVYRIQSMNQQQMQEQFRIEKKQQYSFKSYRPFESHYSMVTDNFPEIYLEYQCQNVSEQKLEMKQIEFRVDKIMDIVKLGEPPQPLILHNEECYKIIYKITIKTKDIQQLNSILVQKKDTTEYDLKLGSIYLQWGTCGIYSGTQKTCLVRLHPVNMRLISPKAIPREIITRVEFEIELGLYVPSLELVIKLDEMEMKAIKIVGMNKMKLSLMEGQRNQRISLDLMAFVGGVHLIRGIKIIDVKSQKPLPFKNSLQICILSTHQQQDHQNINLLDMDIVDNKQPLDLI